MKFEIRIKETNEVIFKGRPSDYSFFLSELDYLFNSDQQDQAIYLVDGKEVSFDEACSAAEDVADARLAKKMETHKLIHWYDGVCGPLATNTHRTAWVRK